MNANQVSLIARYRSAAPNRRPTIRREGPLGAGRRWLALAIATVSCAAALAHRAPGSLSTVEFNQRTGKTEIVHRLHTHDAELGVGAVIERADLSVLSLEDRALIALYVEEKFQIESEEGPVYPSLVGAELAADYLLIYQELIGPLPDVIRVRNDILRDVFPEQINQVNIETDGRVQSLVFANDDGWRRFEAPRDEP